MTVCVQVKRMLLSEKLPQLYSQARESLLASGEPEFAQQLQGCLINSCQSIADDDSAFTVSFDGYSAADIEDTFLTGEQDHSIMVCYSKTNKVIAIDVIGCENSSLKQELMDVC